MSLPNFLFNGPKKSKYTVILAHGAGAPMDSEFLNTFAVGLGEKNLRVVRFEFSYMKFRRYSGKKRPPDRLSVLQAEWNTVIDYFNGNNLIIGGKSMGGRIASMVAVDQENYDHPLKGVICLGYPFHPSGNSKKLRVSHLKDIKTPMLICQGDRDNLGNRSEIETYTLSRSIKFHWLKDGDHSFRPRKASGLTAERNWQSGVDGIYNYIRTLRN